MKDISFIHYRKINIKTERQINNTLNAKADKAALLLLLPTVSLEDHLHPEILC